MTDTRGSGRRIPAQNWLSGSPSRQGGACYARSGPSRETALSGLDRIDRLAQQRHLADAAPPPLCFADIQVFLLGRVAATHPCFLNPSTRPTPDTALPPA